MDKTSLFPCQFHHLIQTYNISQPIQCAFSPLPLIEWSTGTLGDALVQQQIPCLCGFWLLFPIAISWPHTFCEGDLFGSWPKQEACAAGSAARALRNSCAPALLLSISSCRSPYVCHAWQSPSPKAQDQRFVCISLVQMCQSSLCDGFSKFALQGTSKHSSLFPYRLLLRWAHAAFA